uniref:Uncharacterized protein n=1 Tax=Hordeum vulgare subsp. vulgare TaxID=112509 RepID=A0A8I6Y7B1_HORVV
MKKRQLQGNPKCSFCLCMVIRFLPGFCDVYTVGLAAICWAICLARNRATFEKKWINTPFEIVFTACTFLKYWAGLQNPVMMEVVKKGAEMLKENASHMLLLCGPPLPESTEQADEEGWEKW